eukprot:GGOE01061467.1.p1 GENE.GGOE01061467.1~~GGOE01061467.1.p1  ORF type:complete len:383 (+),score=11.69 GGOE01061467.1:62-1150(+)
MIPLLRSYRSPHLSVEDFELGTKLGEGQFGNVWIAREKRYGYIVALKAIRKKFLVENKLERQLQREIEIQANVRHSNVLRLYAWFHDEANIYLVLEYCERGELYGLLQKCGRFPQSVAAWFIKSLVKGLQCLHRKHIIHRDLKPENLLIDHRGVLKIADFGWSVHSPTTRRQTFCGTLDYIPPEQVNQKPYNHMLDLWCIGVLCYELLSGKPPFQDKGWTATTSNIVYLNYRFPPGFPPLAKDFIKKTLVLEPSRRMTLAQMLQHPWLSKWARPPALNAQLQQLLGLKVKPSLPQVGSSPLTTPQQSPRYEAETLQSCRDTSPSPCASLLMTPQRLFATPTPKNDPISPVPSFIGSPNPLRF